MSDLRESAKRVSDCVFVESCGRYHIGLDCAIDASKVCRAYLAEHPEDDDEPVTVEWLEIVGFDFETWESLGSSGCYYTVRGDQIDLEAVPVFAGGLQFQMCCVDHQMPIELKTRGDVRRLCRALKIELKELK